MGVTGTPAYMHVHRCVHSCALVWHCHCPLSFPNYVCYGHPNMYIIIVTKYSGMDCFQDSCNSVGVDTHNAAL